MIVLNEYELRVLGALVEKQIATPDYYPMTLNSLTNACNQKNHRDPVTTFDDQTVARALESLREKNLAYVFHGSDARVPKYGHTFPKYFDLTAQELAVMTVLILRGPQTPGELRSRTPHLFAFDNLPEVETTVQSLAMRSEPLVIKLPRIPGTKEARFAHLLAGDINIEELTAALANEPAAVARGGRGGDERVAKLESEVEELRQAVATLQTQFAEFKKQFE